MEVQTVVGINAWVLHRDEKVFGSDANVFRPERWLGSKEDVANLEKNLFSVCIRSRIAREHEGRCYLLGLRWWKSWMLTTPIGSLSLAQGLEPVSVKTSAFLQ